MAKTPLGINDDDEDRTPDLDVDSFDLDDWVAGITPTIRSAKIYQRPDLVERADDLRRRLRIVEAIPQENRGITDDSPDSLVQEMETVAAELEASGRVIKIQARSTEWLDDVRAKLKKQGVKDDTEVLMHQLAGSIVEPAGFTVKHLQRMREVGDAQVTVLLNTMLAANNQAPEITIPFSSASSAQTGGRRRS